MTYTSTDESKNLQPKIAFNRIPPKGQFVAVWEYNGEIWSSVLRWEREVLLEYGADTDEGWSARSRADDYEKLGAIYFQL